MSNIISYALCATAAIMTAINVTCMIRNNKRFKAEVEWYNAIQRRRTLKEYQKRRMCNHFCKYRESMTEEELEWKCANCPIAEL